MKRGPHKDRKGWFGIGLRADHPDPEDPEDGDDGPTDGLGAGGNGPRSGRSADDGPLGESRASRPNPSDAAPRRGQSGPKNQNPPYHPPRVEQDSERRSASSASSATGGWEADPMRTYRRGRDESEASG
jgi:hypothetical protein